MRFCGELAYPGPCRDLALRLRTNDNRLGVREMTGFSIRGRTLIYGALGLALALTPAVAVVATSTAPAPRVLACQETETEDSFSMNCAPTVIPDTSDNLTEAEVASPGFNAGYGGGQNAGDHPGGHGRG